MRWWITGLAAAILAGCGGSDNASNHNIIIDLEAPTFTTEKTRVAIEENNASVFLTVTTDDANATLALGGIDGDAFALETDGGLRFDPAPDFENPTDLEGDNIYALTVTATDLAGNSADQNITVYVTDVTEGGAEDTTPPRLVSAPEVAVAENETFVMIIETDDINATLALGGADAALFKLAGSELNFNTAPDFEVPGDSNGDNVYLLEIEMTDTAGNSDTAELEVTVTNVDETEKIVLQTGQTLSYDAGGNIVTNESIKDDGYYQKGEQRLYETTSNVVMDNTMGLMWQDTPETNSTQKPWVTQANYDAGHYSDTSGDTAADYCDSLVLEGYRNWRLPTVEELLSLTHKGRAPAIDGNFIYIVPGAYWSSSTSQMNPSSAWSVDFTNGTADNTAKKNEAAYVRCVRAL